MEKMALKKWMRFIAVVLPIVVADQAAKMAAVSHIRFAESLEIIPGFFYLTHLYNTGGGVWPGGGLSPLGPHIVVFGGFGHCSRGCSGAVQKKRLMKADGFPWPCA